MKTRTRKDLRLLISEQFTIKEIREEVYNVHCRFIEKRVEKAYNTIMELKNKSNNEVFCRVYDDLSSGGNPYSLFKSKCNNGINELLQLIIINELKEKGIIFKSIYGILVYGLEK